jgi:hypothetical protein
MTHAMGCSARSRPCNPLTRQPLTALLPSILSLSSGLKSRAKTDPMPKPTKRNVIAESKSYVFLMRRPFCRAPAKLRSNHHPYESKNHATFSKPFVFRWMHHSTEPQVRTFDRSGDKSHRSRACLFSMEIYFSERAREAGTEVKERGPSAQSQRLFVSEAIQGDQLLPASPIHPNPFPGR